MFIIFSGLIFWLMFQPLFFPDTRPLYAAKTKSLMKQIYYSFQLYFEDTETDIYPDPVNLDLDPILIQNASGENFIELSLNSPYYFFQTGGQKFHKSSKKTLATNWEAIPQKPYYIVVWEDGRVTNISREEQQKLIQSSLKGSLTSLLYKLSFKNNKVFK